MKMKYTSLVLRIVAPTAIGIWVGRFITPLLNLESLWLNIVVSTARTIPLGEIKNLHKVKKHEIPQAAWVLADAFAQDPLFQALFGDASKNTHK